MLMCIYKLYINIFTQTFSFINSVHVQDGGCSLLRGTCTASLFYPSFVLVTPSALYLLIFFYFFIMKNIFVTYFSYMTIVYSFYNRFNDFNQSKLSLQFLIYFSNFEFRRWFSYSSQNIFKSSLCVRYIFQIHYSIFHSRKK